MSQLHAFLIDSLMYAMLCGWCHVYVGMLCVAFSLSVYINMIQHTGNATTQPARYGKGSGVSLLDQVVCHGNETSLLSCTHAQVGSRECTYQQDASATCIGESPSPSLPGG